MGKHNDDATMLFYEECLENQVFYSIFSSLMVTSST